MHACLVLPGPRGGCGGGRVKHDTATQIHCRRVLRLCRLPAPSQPIGSSSCKSQSPPVGLRPPPALPLTAAAPGTVVDPAPAAGLSRPPRPRVRWAPPSSANANWPPLFHSSFFFWERTCFRSLEVQRREEFRELRRLGDSGYLIHGPGVLPPEKKKSK